MTYEQPRTFVFSDGLEPREIELLLHGVRQQRGMAERRLSDIQAAITHLEGNKLQRIGTPQEERDLRDCHRDQPFLVDDLERLIALESVLNESYWRPLNRRVGPHGSLVRVDPKGN